MAEGDIRRFGRSRSKDRTNGFSPADELPKGELEDAVEFRVEKSKQALDSRFANLPCLRRSSPSFELRGGKRAHAEASAGVSGGADEEMRDGRTGLPNFKKDLRRGLCLFRIGQGFENASDKRR